MPLYKFKCPTCGPVQRIIDRQAYDGIVCCKKCGAVLKPAPTGGSTLVMETIDSGAQARETVRPADAQRLFAERELEHDRQHGDGKAEYDEELTAPIDDDGDII